MIFLANKPSDQFISETTFLIKSNQNGGISPSGSLSILAGINSQSSMGLSTNSEISPSLYPILISSIDFKKKLIEAPLTLNDLGRKLTYAKYYEEIVKPTRIELVKNYIFGLPSLLSNFEKSTISENPSIHTKNKILRLSSSEKAHFSRLEKQLKIESRDGVMSLSFSMEDPLIAAQMAQYSFDLLQNEIIAFKLANINEELRFTELLYNDKKESFENIQRELGYFRDRNKNVIASSIQNQLERLQSEYNLRFNVVTQIANSLESTKIQIAKNTPVFTILDPVTIPSATESKSRVKVLLISIAFGIILSISFIIIMEFLKNFKNKWDEIN
jgi:hypothetical protein